MIHSHQLAKGLSHARQDDTGSLKKVALSYVFKDPNEQFSPPLKPNALKAERGWKHPATARLLTPLMYAATEALVQRLFIADVVTLISHLNRNFLLLKSLSPGTLQATASNLPRFLYPDNQEYDPDDIEAGLFYGHFLLFVRPTVLIT